MLYAKHNNSANSWKKNYVSGSVWMREREGGGISMHIFTIPQKRKYPNKKCPFYIIWIYDECWGFVLDPPATRQ